MNRVFVTLGAVAVSLFARQILLPGLEPQPGFTGTRGMLSIVALGVYPLIVGAILVELAALALPGLRALRVGGPEGRAQLQRAALLVGLGLALLQAVVFTQSLVASGSIAPLEASGRALMVLTLFTGCLALAVLAKAVDRFGVGSGLAMLVWGGLASQTVDRVWYVWQLKPASAAGSEASWVAPGVLGATVAAAVAAWLYFRGGRGAADGATGSDRLSRPACGITPLSLAGALVSLAVVIATYAQGSGSRAVADPSLARHWLVHLGLAVVGAFVFTRVFNAPGRVANGWRSLAPESTEPVPRWNLALGNAVGFVAAIVLAGVFCRYHLGVLAPDLVGVVIITAVLRDLTLEIQALQAREDLVSVWEIHQDYLVAPAMLGLAGAGVSAIAKGRHLHALLQFFGPYAPVRILVPAAEAARANEFLRARWPSR